MEFSRARLARRVMSRLTPAQFLVLSYGLILLIGTALLSSDQAMVVGSLELVDALFMAASALCVTGLSVVNLGADFTIMGQVVIAVLIQIGALGVMTMSTLFALLLGRRIGLRSRMFLQEDLNQNYLAGIVRLVRYVLVLTLIIEAVGAVLLLAVLYPAMPLGDAAYYAVFHSISAFGNAGFDLFGSSLETFLAQPLIPLTISVLFILGGLGFPVLIELLQWRRERHLSLHSRIVLWSTGILIGGAWIALLFWEFSNPATLGLLSLDEKVMAAFFTAVTPRTAGFNVVPTAALSEVSLVLIMVLMFVGASPSSTGGGIKTTTSAALLLGVWATISGSRDVELGKRRITQEYMLKAWAITFLAAAWVIMVTMLLLISEQMGLLPMLFEVVSAFGTVGLSMGITGELSSPARLLLAITMFLGRLGPMTLALALGQRELKRPLFRYPVEPIGLG